MDIYLYLLQTFQLIVVYGMFSILLLLAVKVLIGSVNGYKYD